MTIGVDIEGVDITIGIVDSGMIFRKKMQLFPVNESETNTIVFLKENIAQLLNSNIKGIGIGVPSIVDSLNGIIYNTINIPSWKKVHLKEILQNEFNIPTYINNDCNCFAFGERYYGNGKPFHNLVGLTLGTGVGAGIIINDVLYPGMNTGAGEIGSLPYLDKDYEYFCSKSFFEQRYNVLFTDMLHEAKQGNKESLSIFNEFGYHVGNLLQLILFTYAPQAIIIGGPIVLEGFQYFRDAMYAQTQKFLYPETLEQVKIICTTTSDVRLLGAASLVP